ncbi:MAG: response regulator transcription factor [Alphaproteobacteria bacterium]|nr:response regulator transcription factor [Alphaproteobacteria bacterium]
MKVLIADDHALFRDALGKLVESLDDTITIVQTSNFAQTLKILNQENDFDLIITDLEMSDVSSWEQGFEKIKKAAPTSKIVIISASENIRNIRNILEKGACGFISKRSENNIMTSALKLVLDGGTYVPSTLLNRNTDNMGKNKILTHRQNQVLGLVAQGMSNKQIAYEIGVSEATVKLHINALLRSVGATNRTQAVITAQKMGII